MKGFDQVCSHCNSRREEGVERENGKETNREAWKEERWNFRLLLQRRMLAIK